ncbi:MAG: hypothetical protein AMXMBFR48_28040 [Ignavibacteriales bacterium]
MIFVTRTAKPKVLIKNDTKWTKAIKAAKTKEQLKKAVEKYKHAEIKQSLLEMFHGKCGFCESKITNVDFGDIEHFKPKSIFPELAVTWENLLLSCKKCNGSSQKSDHWPGAREGGPLVNPCEENPDKFFEFVYDKKTRVSFVKPKNKRAKVSEQIYGLNKTSLLQDRSDFIRKLIVVAYNYKKSSEAREIIDEAVKDSGEYAAFARMVKKKFTNV